MTKNSLTPPDDAIWEKACETAKDDGKQEVLEKISPQDRNYLLKLLRQTAAEITEGKDVVRDIHQLEPAQVRIEYSSSRSGRGERDVEIFQLGGPIDRFGDFTPDQFFAFDEERRRKQFRLDRVTNAYAIDTGEIIPDLAAYLLPRQMKR